MEKLSLDLEISTPRKCRGARPTKCTLGKQIRKVRECLNLTIASATHSNRTNPLACEVLHLKKREKPRVAMITTSNRPSNIKKNFTR